jgi:glyceraldehyde-3-phosphate dehydrogenase (NADP+)
MSMKMLIGGLWVDRKEKIEVRNPYDDSIVDTVPAASAEDMKTAIASAVEGFEQTRRLSTLDRITILADTARMMKERHEDLARLLSSEGSKTIREARFEVGRAITTMTVASEEARRLNGETLPFDSREGSSNRRGYYYRFPIGVIGAITPFNDPLNLVAHKLGPALAGGNSVVLKPATVTPLVALRLGELILEAGWPPKGLNIVTGHGQEIGDALVADERVRMITFTGGPEAGLAIVKKAGLKKIGMELGSNSAVIVMDDADLGKAVSSCVDGAFGCAGQNCIGVQRLFVHEDIFETFQQQMVSRTQKLVVGPQHDEKTDVGPMITEGEARRIESWVQEAAQAGGQILTGGSREGSVYQPTIMKDVPMDAKVVAEEVFAPVVVLFPFTDLARTIEIINRSKYGLHAGIFTQDINTAYQAIEGIDVGGIMVNDTSDYRIDQMPFGGVKLSGLGREGLRYALLEMTEPKVVCFNL